MKPDKVEELIQNHLDMSLSSEEKAELEKYMEMNTYARLDHERYRKILALLELEETLEPPEDFTDKVMARLPEVEFSSLSQLARGGIFEGLGFSTGLTWVAVAAIVFIAIFSTNNWLIQSEKPQIAQRASVDLKGNDSRFEITDNSLQETFEPKLTQEKKLSDLKLFLTVIEGYVYLGNGDRNGISYQAGSREAIYPGQLIRTSQKGFASILYSDGKTTLNLKPKTELKVIDSSTFHLKHGDVWVEIRKKVDRFEVKTDHLVAAVRGTRFAVRADTIDWATRRPLSSGSSTVGVFEGLVEVKSRKNSKLDGELLIAGQSVTVSNKALFKASLSDQDYRKWDESIPAGDSNEGNPPKRETVPGKAFDKVYD